MNAIVIDEFDFYLVSDVDTCSLSYRGGFIFNWGSCFCYGLKYVVIISNGSNSYPIFVELQLPINHRTAQTAQEEQKKDMEHKIL